MQGRAVQAMLDVTETDNGQSADWPPPWGWVTKDGGWNTPHPVQLGVALSTEHWCEFNQASRRASEHHLEG